MFQLNDDRFNAVNVGKVPKAIEFVQLYHANQKYLEMPYYYHCKNVAIRAIDNLTQDTKMFKIMAKHRGHSILSLDELIAIALLHDVLEDNSTDKELPRLVYDEFGHYVFSIVSMLVHRPIETYAQYIDRLIMDSGTATYIKFCDVSENLFQTLGQEYDKKRTKRYMTTFQKLQRQI